MQGGLTREGRHMAEKTLLTSDDLFKLRPSKKIDRWLFRGELRESKVTKRNPNHSGCVAKIGYLLEVWLRAQSKPRGKVYVGEAYFRIREEPETNVGIDVALASPEQVAAIGKKTKFAIGPPIVAVEVLSPNDKHQAIIEMIEEYLDCGVKLIWIVDPFLETVDVYRPSKKPVRFNADQHLTGEDVLPGFRCHVAEIFE